MTAPVPGSFRLSAPPGLIARLAADGSAAKVWCQRRILDRLPRTKPESALDSADKTLWVSSRIGIHDYRRRIGVSLLGPSISVSSLRALSCAARGAGDADPAPTRDVV